MTRVPLWLLLVVAALGLGAFLWLVRATEPPPALHGVDALRLAANDPQELVGADWVRPPGTEARYAGDAACRSCHPREFAGTAGSPHTRAARPLREGEIPAEFAVAPALPIGPPGIRLGTATVEHQPCFTASSASGETRASPRWVIGSGNQAHTYLCPQGSRFLESRITYYSRWKQWGFTPGRGPEQTTSQPLGELYSPLAAASCFGCHSTLVVGTAEALDLARSRPGVGCEACHGPSRVHVEEATRAAERRTVGTLHLTSTPPLARGDAVMGLCGRCHFIPVPDQPVTVNDLARQTGLALGRSRCFRESGGRLTCVTCHDPHAPLATTPTAYDAACKSCHAPAAGKAACKFGKTTACAGCHLPSPPLSRDFPLRLHDHWIRVNTGGSLPAGAQARGKTVPDR